MKSGILQTVMLNSTIRSYYLVILLLLCFTLQSYSSFAQSDPKKNTILLAIDSSNVQIRKMDPESQQQLLENSDYQYDRIGPAPKTLWDRIKEWFWRAVDEIFSSDGGKIGLSIFQYILIIAVIIIIVLLVLKNDIRAVFYGKSASVPIDFKEFEDDIHKINFDELITDAISKKDFRKAVRLHFLKLLKELTDSNLITWQIDKTNNDYSMELSNSKYSGKFKELALMYEYVWYGDLKMDEEHFKNTIRKFKEFNLQEN